MDNDFYIQILLETAEKAGRGGEAQRATEIIVDFVRSLSSSETNQAEYIPPFDQLPEPIGSAERLEAAIPRLLAAADLWRKQGADAEDRLQVLQDIPEPLRRRLLAEHLRAGLPDDFTQARDFLMDQLTGVRAFPEGLALLRDLLDDRTETDPKEFIACFGSPPSAVAVATWSKDEPFPEEWTRARSWLVAFPEEAYGDWGKAILVLDQRRGAPRSDGRLMGDFESFTGPTSPFGLDELASMPPMAAAEQIGLWEPDKGAHFGPTPRGLERTLQQVIEQAPAAWTEDALQIISKLHHPTYIYGYFNGLKSKAQEVVARSKDLAEAALVVTAEPWAVVPLHPDDFEADQDWSSASEAAIDLLGALAAAEGDFESSWPEVTALVYQRATDTADSTHVSGDSIDPLTAALNRASTRALDVAFALSEHEPRKGDGLSAEFLEVIDHWLSLDDAGALEGRALIAPRMPYLRYHNPEWFEENQELLIGAAAPSDYGNQTFGLYLKWGRPRVEFLRDFTAKYFEALKLDEQASLQHLLHGYLWGVEPLQKASFVLERLAEKDLSTVSNSARVLARLVGTADDSGMVEKAISYWKTALDLDLGPHAYPGFGSFSRLSSIPNEEWRELTLQTVQRSDGDINASRKVAERAAETPSEAGSLEIVLRILRGEPRLWEAHRIAQVAQEMVREPSASTGDNARRHLREFLLQRGYYEVADLE